MGSPERVKLMGASCLPRSSHEEEKPTAQEGSFDEDGLLPARLKSNHVDWRGKIPPTPHPPNRRGHTPLTRSYIIAWGAITIRHSRPFFSFLNVLFPTVRENRAETTRGMAIRSRFLPVTPLVLMMLTCSRIQPFAQIDREKSPVQDDDDRERPPKKMSLALRGLALGSHLYTPRRHVFIVRKRWPDWEERTICRGPRDATL